MGELAKRAGTARMILVIVGFHFMDGSVFGIRGYFPRISETV